MNFGKARIIARKSDMDEAILALQAIPEKLYPVRLEVKREHKRRKETSNRALNAHLRDIARFRYGAMTVPERVFEKCVNDFKVSPIWPKHSDPEPDYYTGEVLYNPKSRADLTTMEVSGIVAWLSEYMNQRGIPSFGPTDQGEPT